MANLLINYCVFFNKNQLKLFFDRLPPLTSGCRARTNTLPDKKGVQQQRHHRSHPKLIHQKDRNQARPAGDWPSLRGQGHDCPYQGRGGGGGRERRMMGGYEGRWNRLRRNSTDAAPLVIMVCIYTLGHPWRSVPAVARARARQWPAHSTPQAYCKSGCDGGAEWATSAAANQDPGRDAEGDPLCKRQTWDRNDSPPIGAMVPGPLKRMKRQQIGKERAAAER